MENMNQNGRTKRGKQDQQDLDRAEGEGMSKSSAGGASTDAAGLLGIRSVADVKAYWVTLQERIERQVQLRPLATVGTAVGLGLGVGLLLRRGLLGAILATAAGLAFRQIRS